MPPALKIDGVRGRLTLFYVVVLAMALVVVGGLIYVLLARALYTRIDDGLKAVVQVAATSLANDLAENQDEADAARSTAAELSSRQQMLALYDAGGQLLAEGGRDDDLQLTLPPLGTILTGDPALLTIVEAKDDDDRHRLAVSRVVIADAGVTYIVVAGTSLEPTDEELESLRGILAYVVPIALLLTAIGGWFLARQSLSPIEAALEQQRRFMADASHELRTPVATTRTAASVALQQPHRDEAEYRDTLEIVEQQTVRLSRIVEDMFTLARADAGNYPVLKTPMYLDEVVEDVARAARVIATTMAVSIEIRPSEAVPFTGDEDLIKRLVGNLLDNAIRYAPADTAVTVTLESCPGGVAISISDRGPGIPAEIQPHIFERFYRGDAARTRSDRAAGGAGLGLALVRWIAGVHGGDARLVHSSSAGTTFTAYLPTAG